MARNMQPIAKRCKALNLSPAAMGYAKKNTNRNPKGQMRKKQSEYALQLTEAEGQVCLRHHGEAVPYAVSREGFPYARQDRREPADPDRAPPGQRCTAWASPRPAARPVSW